MDINHNDMANSTEVTTTSSIQKYYNSVRQNIQKFGGNFVQSSSMMHQAGFEHFYGVSVSEFEFLLFLAAQEIHQNVIVNNLNIKPQDGLAVALRFLTTGDSYDSLMYQFQIPVSSVIPLVCSALITSLSEYTKLDRNQEAWSSISEVFQSKTDFPHCIGAIDAKVMVLQNFKYPGSADAVTVKIIFLGIVDAQYKFIYANTEYHMMQPNGNILNYTDFGKSLILGRLNLPPRTSLYGRQMQIPYFLVADRAFPLSENVMKSYSGRYKKGTKESIFNYRLDRVRRVAENAFGVMASKFRVLAKPLQLDPINASHVSLTCVYLHNFLRTTSPDNYFTADMLDREENGSIINGSWRKDMSASTFLPLKRVGRKSPYSCLLYRDELAEYFSTIGSIPGQEKYA